MEPYWFQTLDHYQTTGETVLIMVQYLKRVRTLHFWLMHISYQIVTLLIYVRNVTFFVYNRDHTTTFCNFFETKQKSKIRGSKLTVFEIL